MKRYVITLLLLVLGIVFSFQSVFSQDGWQWLNPLPQGNPLRDVYLFNDTTAIAVGSAGTVMKTHDKGETWDIQYHINSTTLGLSLVTFANDNLGITCEYTNKIYRTTDGGNDWETHTIGDYYFNDICALTEKKWLMSASGKMLRSSDGGLSWTEVIAEESIYLEGMTVIDTNNVLVVGLKDIEGFGQRGIVMTTRDGGLQLESTILYDD